MSLIYTKEKVTENAYIVTTTIDGVEHTFNCIVANDTEADLNELVQWNIDNLNATLIAPQPTYTDKRRSEYPPIEDYLDGIVKGDQEQIDNYIADCLAVKAKYPKP